MNAFLWVYNYIIKCITKKLRLLFMYIRSMKDGLQGLLYHTNSYVRCFKLKAWPGVSTLTLSTQQKLKISRMKKIKLSYRELNFYSCHRCELFPKIIKMSTLLVTWAVKLSSSYLQEFLFIWTVVTMFRFALWIS